MSRLETKEEPQLAEGQPWRGSPDTVPFQPTTPLPTSSTDWGSKGTARATIKATSTPAS